MMEQEIDLGTKKVEIVMLIMIFTMTALLFGFMIYLVIFELTLLTISDFLEFMDVKILFLLIFIVSLPFWVWLQKTKKVFIDTRSIKIKPLFINWIRYEILLSDIRLISLVDCRKTRLMNQLNFSKLVIYQWNFKRVIFYIDQSKIELFIELIQQYRMSVLTAEINIVKKDSTVSNATR